MFIEPTITWVPSGFSGYIWLDTKIVLKKKKKKIVAHSGQTGDVLLKSHRWINHNAQATNGLQWRDDAVCDLD